MKAKFEKNPEGFLSYNNEYSFAVRITLNFFKNVLSWIIKKKSENTRINKKIFQELELPLDTRISELDAFHKREFRKKKYIYSLKSKESSYFPEPKKIYLPFIPTTHQSRQQTTTVKFFKEYYREEEK